MPTHVAGTGQNTDQWHVVLVENSEPCVLVEGLGFIDQRAQEYFTVVELKDADKSPVELNYFPDDWTRYVTTACFADGDTTENISCAVDANLDIDQSHPLGCLQYAEDMDSRTGCLTDENLDEEQAALLECSRHSGSVAEFSLCSAEKPGKLSREELLAAECLMKGSAINASTLMDCAGGRFAGNEISQCLSDAPQSLSVLILN